MDILCVDQRSFEARIGVIKHIPAIYRAAQKTVIIREPGGPDRCCAAAIGEYKSWREDAAQRLFQHIQSAHIDGLVETWLERLWPLQEALLSDRLQFTVCDNVSSAEVEKDWVPFTARMAFRTIFDGLSCISRAWITYGIEEDGEEQEYRPFFNAFFKNGHVARRQIPSGRHRTRPLVNDFIIHLNSLRQASKPRDFILAILPQYGWY